MVDKYVNWVNSSLGRKIAKKLGLPTPVKLKRYSTTKHELGLNALAANFKNSDVTFEINRILANQAINHFIYENGEILRQSSAGPYQLKDEKFKFHGLIFDATKLENTQDLQSIYDFFHSLFRRINTNGRIIIFANNPQSCQDLQSSMVARALVGFVKSLAKEVRRGITVQLVYLDQEATQNIQSTLEFLLSFKSTYVSGQVISIKKANIFTVNSQKPLNGKLALVTGASKGIGKAIAQTLARDGAKIVCLDVESQQASLEKLATSLDGFHLTLDITAANAPDILADFAEKHGGWDIIVHNAGITKDKMFVNMTPEIWNQVLTVNLAAQEKINHLLLAQNKLNTNGRIICVSSIAGIAGNAGQTNYATSKAGVIGLVDYTAKHLVNNGITINAVAPGFIETEMTAKIPFMIREVGRRINALSQGGQPIDVAETIAWFANPASSGINGNVIRVCGLSILGA